MDLNQESSDNHSPVEGEEVCSSPEEEGKALEFNAVEQEDLSEESDRVQKKGEKQEKFPSQFLAFKQAFEEQTDPEIKLQLAVDFMESSLAQGGTPHFRSFWEARRLCLGLFKESINPALRSYLWGKYSELSKEARRLKDILDEQSAFAVEQIEIAIQALEKEINALEESCAESALSEPLIFPEALKEKQDAYQRLQYRLNMLNAQAARINALRKELLKIDMRVKFKSKFFQRLSSAGDKVFPKRKELIKELSHLFSDDVEQFIKDHFKEKEVRESFFILREEIKTFQGLAKALTINTHAFTTTRTVLSECWNDVKSQEKEKKKERLQQREAFKENSDQVEQQIQALKELIEKGEESPAELQNKINSLSFSMRQVQLGRNEVKVLRGALNELRKIVQDKVKAEENIQLRQAEEQNRQRVERYKAFKEQVENLLYSNDELEADQLVEKRDALLENIHSSPLAKGEKQEFERMMKPLRDIIADKKEKALLALSDDDRHALKQLQSILEQRNARRQEIKTHLEHLRKGAGSSGLDFEKAITLTNQINEEKERLEKSNRSIDEIEKRIRKHQTAMRG